MDSTPASVTLESRPQRGTSIRTLALITILSCIFAVGITLHRGQDSNWDQLNYHFSDVHALVHHTYWRDIAVSQMQSWFNPLPYVLPYWLAGLFDGLTCQIVLSLIQALNAPLLFLVALEVQPREAPRRTMLAAIATALGMTAAIVVSEIGTTIYDIMAALFVLGSALLVLRSLRAEGSRSQLLLAAAGLLMGLVVGLKLVNAVFALATMLILPFFCTRKTIIARSAVYSLAAAAGFLLSAGWWMALLWHEYGNPFFPYFNLIFHSPWLDGLQTAISGGTGADLRFIPASLHDAILFPIRMARGGAGISTETWFRDARVLAAILGSIVYVAGAFRRGSPTSVRDAERFLIAFWLLSFAIWLRIFAIERYIIPLELLTGPVLLIAARALMPTARGAAAFALVALLLMAWSRPTHADGLPFRASMFATDDVRPIHVAGALYVMIGDEPMGYVVPAMPRDVRFVRIDGNLALDPAKGLGRVARDIIASHSGPVMSLEATSRTTPADAHGKAQAALARFGLSKTMPCRAATGPGQTLQACTLKHG